MDIPDTIAERIACPDCKQGLAEAAADELLCSKCNCRFPVAANGSLPILFSAKSQLARQEYAGWQRTVAPGTRKKDYREARMLPKTNVAQIQKPHKEQFLEMVGEGIILNIGSGQRHISMAKNWVGLDIEPHANCEVVADAHWLPFLDSCFDAVISDSVFEHLRQPFHAASEIARVLKPNGIMWCHVPLCYPIHGDPNDYFRYTPDGLRSVFSELKVIEVGPAGGPLTGIAVWSERVADALFPGKLGFPARWATAWTLHPLKYLDPWLVRRDPECATGCFIVARKPNAFC